jgi:SNF2 family DNA or RNA helicase
MDEVEMSKVNAERVGNRIYVRAPFSRKDELKSVLGARWSPKAKAWTYPLDLEVCRLLRETFGDDLVVGEELWAWASVERDRETDLSRLTNVTDIDVMKEIYLPNVAAQAPTMWAAMLNRPYQPVASYYMARAGTCLNADQPGVGKTIETLGALVEAGVRGPVLVLAPKTSCLTVWQNEIERWLADDVKFTITQTAGLSPIKRADAYARFLQATKEHGDGINFLIANAEQAGIKKFTECPDGICDGDEDWCPSLEKHVNKSEKRRPFLHSIAWQAIIADETHKWLINTRGKSASQVGYGFTRLTTVDGGLRYSLTGTPLKGKKHNLFGTLNWLRPKIYTSKWRWIEQYFHVTTEKVDAGRKGIIETKVIGDMNEAKQEAFFRSLNAIMIRRSKDELRKINPAWMPPEKQYHDVWVDMEPKQRAHYNAMAKDAEANLDGAVLSATGVLAVMTRLRQFCNSAGELRKGVFFPTLPSSKFNWLLQFLSERGIDAKGELSDDIRKVVVASQFTKQIKAWHAELERLGIDALMLTGETSDKKRDLHVKEFQSNPDIRVFLINTTAGGVSITLDAADDIVIMDETWVPDEQEQVEDRVHRASNVTHQVDVWYVRTKGTIEEDLAALGESKAKSNHVVLDAQRGLRFAAERFGTTIKKGKEES